MKRFLVYTLILWLISTVAVGAAKLISKQAPLSESLRMLNLADCAQPCWLGIKPGITTSARAAQKIGHVYTNRDFGKVSVDTFPSGVIFLNGVTMIGQIYVTANSNVVSQIRFILSNGDITFPVEDFITLFGQPSYRSGRDGSGNYILRFGPDNASTLRMITAPIAGSRGCRFRVYVLIFSEPGKSRFRGESIPWDGLDSLRRTEGCPSM